MKILIRASTAASNLLSRNQLANARKHLNSIIFYMWYDGLSRNIGGPESTAWEVAGDYLQSDYTSFSTYVFDHKDEIFDDVFLDNKIHEYATGKRNQHEIEEAMWKMYNELTEADFTRNLYLRRDDPKQNKKSRYVEA